MILTRRRTISLLGCAFAAPAIGPAFAQPAFAQTAFAQTPGMSRMTAYAFTFAGLNGPDIRLGEHAGKPILVVNTASQCGYTPQFTGLQQLYERYHERGLMIVAVPSNDFGGQEPGTPVDIMHTAHDEYGVTFPLAEKAVVKGGSQHPFYKWAATERPLETPRWNFHKYLIGRNGRLKGAFTPAVEPNDPRLVAAIEKELAAKRA